MKKPPGLKGATAGGGGLSGRSVHGPGGRLDAGDLVFQLKFATLEFHQLEVVRRGSGYGVVYLPLDRSVTLFELREMSLQGHAIVSFILPNPVRVTRKSGQVEGFDVVRRTIDVRRGMTFEF